MNQVKRILILVFVLIYAISPIDALPGPVDDILLAILGLVANKRLSAKT